MTFAHENALDRCINRARIDAASRSLVNQKRFDIRLTCRTDANAIWHRSHELRPRAPTRDGKPRKPPRDPGEDARFCTARNAGRSMHAWVRCCVTERCAIDTRPGKADRLRVDAEPGCSVPPDTALLDPCKSGVGRDRCVTNRTWPEFCWQACSRLQVDFVIVPLFRALHRGRLL